MCYTPTFWKCIRFEDMGSITKVMSMKVKNVTWRFCPFIPLEWSNDLSDESLPISTLFPFKNSFLQRVCLLRIVTQRVKEVLARLLPCSGVTGKWHNISGNYNAGQAKWRENNGAKMTSRLRQKFPERMSEAKRVKITLPRFSFLAASGLTPKEDFEQLFNFQGPVISECTIIVALSSLTWVASLSATAAPCTMYQGFFIL